MRHPPPLAPGARVALVCPSGPLKDNADLERAVANAKSFGWEPVPGASVLAHDGYFAGTDTQRLQDINAAFRDHTIDGVWCIRGGYGAMRLLEGLDYDAIGHRPRPLIGFSDITALHAAVGSRCELVSFHGPTARAELTPFSRDSLDRAVVRGVDSCGVAPAARTLRKGAARGRLVGGNLAILAALAGTNFAPAYENAIIVVEDINEPVYRIERMLLTLRLGDAFASCTGLVFGSFTGDTEQPPADGTRTLETVLQEVADTLRIPCIAGAPVGHIADQWTLPLGAMAELDADARSLTVLQPSR